MKKDDNPPTGNTKFSSRAPGPKLGVIGVGGAGNNAVNRMIEDGVSYVKFIAANTDLQVLEVSKAGNIIQLGEKLTNGMGAGAVPETGLKAAEESRDEIRSSLSGFDMLFITAGMGGGTGTGASPLVAAIAKELGILTVAIVTKPFKSEGKRKEKIASEGISQLTKHVDTIITVPNERLREVYKGLDLKAGFKKADEVLSNATRAISSLIFETGIMNVDFADILTTLKDKGQGHIGMGIASGKDRAKKAVEAAINSPLLELSIEGAKHVIVAYYYSSSNTLTFEEFDDVNAFLEDALGGDDGDILIIPGNFEDERLGDDLLVTIIATGGDGAGGIIKDKPKPTKTITSPKLFDSKSSDSDELPEVEKIQIPNFLKK